MFKFTKGKEMEELKELFNRKMIIGVVTKDKITYLSSSMRYGNLGIGSKVLILDSALICPESIDWKETAKLVKEDKVEKAVVRSWDDLGEYALYSKYEGYKEIYFGNENILISESYLKLAVNLLNKSGKNYEYHEVEVIDTYEKLFEFLGKINKVSEGGQFISYDYTNKLFDLFDQDSNYLESVKIKDIEKLENVDLKILKGGE